MSQDKDSRYLSANGWKNTGGIIPFWSHKKITGGRLTYKYHALHYQKEYEAKVATTNGKDGADE